VRVECEVDVGVGSLVVGGDIHPVHGAAPLRSGTRDPGSYLAGALADIAIYPRVLSAAEILHNFSGA